MQRSVVLCSASQQQQQQASTTESLATTAVVVTVSTTANNEFVPQSPLAVSIASNFANESFCPLLTVSSLSTELENHGQPASSIATCTTNGSGVCPADGRPASDQNHVQRFRLQEPVVPAIGNIGLSTVWETCAQRVDDLFDNSLRHHTTTSGHLPAEPSWIGLPSGKVAYRKVLSMVTMDNMKKLNLRKPCTVKSGDHLHCVPLQLTRIPLSLLLPFLKHLRASSSLQRLPSLFLEHIRRIPTYPFPFVYLIVLHLIRLLCL